MRDKRVIVTHGKRPFDATPERALELNKTLSQAEIAKLWNISRQRVQQLVNKAKGG